MRILHLAAGDRWTGAAAPAFAETEALRLAGVEADYAYVGGYKLEAKLADVPFAHPWIEKAQNPVAFLRTVRRLHRFVRLQHIDVIHAHLTWDHWLAVFASRGTGARVVRTFHSRRTIRRDPLTGALLRATAAVFVVNETFASEPAIRDFDPLFTPPPLDGRQFSAAGDDVRGRYGLHSSTPVLAYIGKMSKGRGFEEALQTMAAIRPTLPDARLLLIGHGEHRPALEQLAADLGVADAVVWAGYHEEDLASHYRAADVLLFTAAGSDEGHRAILEAMGCGVLPAVFPISGMQAILGDLSSRCIARDPSPEALAKVAIALLRTRGDPLRMAAVAETERYSYLETAGRLITGYRGVM